MSYRDLEEMMRERGLRVDHTTISRWVQRYAPELEKRCRPHLNITNDSWRVDETSIKVKKQWVSLAEPGKYHGHAVPGVRRLSLSIASMTIRISFPFSFLEHLILPSIHEDSACPVPNEIPYPPMQEVRTDWGFQNLLEAHADLVVDANV